jgi:hypothetical protein
MKTFLSALVVVLAAAAPVFATGPNDLLGTWYVCGNPSMLCNVTQVDHGPQGVFLSFNDYQGATAEGILADDYTITASNNTLIGHLSGDPRVNGVINWSNGMVWTRGTSYPQGWDAPYAGYRDWDEHHHDWRHHEWDHREHQWNPRYHRH